MSLSFGGGLGLFERDMYFLDGLHGPAEGRGDPADYFFVGASYGTVDCSSSCKAVALYYNESNASQILWDKVTEDSLA